MHRLTKRQSRALVAVAAVGALLLASCSGGTGGDAATDTGGDAATPSSEQISQEDIDAAMTTETDLTFWTWVPDIQNQVDLFEAKYPAINVEVVNLGNGAPQYQKLRTALKAGTGVPDVAIMEFQYLPSYLLGDNLLDIAPYIGSDITDVKGDYPEWVWSQLSRGDAVYGLPLDIGPMGNLYREDLLAEAGIEVPATWEEFGEAARTYREANPDKYLTNLPGSDPGQFVGLLWQAGARPFGYDGAETVTIDLDTPEVAKVIDFWNPLVQEDVVGVDPDFTDQWYQGLAKGTYASWQTAAWGPLFLQGTAGETSGLWRAAPLPQWDGEVAAGNWGGSVDSVMKATENPIAAAQFVLFISTDPEAALKLATEQFLFPASQTIQEDSAFLEQEAEFYGGQQVNKLFVDIATTVGTDFEWLPFMDFAYSSYGETLGKAFADRTDLNAGLTAWETALEDYATAQGFTVE